MGEPITLYKPDGETQTAYGPAQADALKRDGWQTEPATADGGAMVADSVEVAAPPEPKPEPRPRRAGRKGEL